jgi:GTPase SAR1 family protein
VGPCGSGKTALFYAITEPKLFVRAENKMPKTVTSMTANEARSSRLDPTFTPLLVDIPGHSRVRSDLIKKKVVNSRVIVFVFNGKVLGSTTVRDYVKDFVDCVRECQVAVLDAAIKKQKPVFVVTVHQDDAGVAGEKTFELIQKEIDRELELRTKSDAETNTMDFPALNVWTTSSVWDSSKLRNLLRKYISR